MNRLSADKRDAFRDSECRVVLESISPFCNLDGTLLGRAMIVAALCSADNGEASEVDLKIIHAWADAIHTQITMLQLVLSGGVRILVEDGEVAFKLAEPDEAMRQFVRTGIAKPTSPSAAPPATGDTP